MGGDLFSVIIALGLHPKTSTFDQRCLVAVGDVAAWFVHLDYSRRGVPLTSAQLYTVCVNWTRRFGVQRDRKEIGVHAELEVSSSLWATEAHIVSIAYPLPYSKCVFLYTQVTPLSFFRMKEVCSSRSGHNAPEKAIPCISHKSILVCQNIFMVPLVVKH